MSLSRPAKPPCSSEATGYRAGIQRIHLVRSRMPDEWADTACVRALDERLHLAA